MSSEIAISVKDLTKTYRVFGHPGDRIRQALTFGRVRFHRDFTALKDVSFEIKKGETVGIIGRNGSGKSTLLQLICGILKPTSGSVRVNGRVSALLELGAGFNPEFTGRENVYFQGAVIGLPKAEIDTRIEDIASFADIGEFIDQPVRTYSSGMFVRLAFAVAVHVDADILVVDEALAVGDSPFQTKCLRHMKEMMQHGVTVIFVTHDMNMAKSLCQRAIYIDHGKIKADGECGAVGNLYISDQMSAIEMLPPSEKTLNSTFSKRRGYGSAKILKILLFGETQRTQSEFDFGQEIVVQVWFQSEIDLDDINVAFHFVDKSLLDVLGTNTEIEQSPIGRIKKGTLYRTEFRFRNPLRSGDYSITVILAGELEGRNVFFDIWDEALFMKSIDSSPVRRWSMVGVPTRVTHQTVDRTIQMSDEGI